MPVTVEANISRTDETHASIEVTVPLEEIEKSIKKTVQKLKSTQKFKGFRQGKVPDDVVYSTFGKEGVHAEVLGELLPHAYDEALRKVRAVPMGEPDITPLPSIEDGKPLVFTAKLEVLPEVKLCPIDSFDLDVEEAVEVTESDVEQYIDNFLQQMAESAPVDGRPCSPGDEIALDYKIADKESKQFETMEGVRIILGRKLILPEIEDQLTGMSKDEVKTFPVSYPANYQNEKLAGKDMNVTVTLKEIKERKVPELTDKLLEEKRMGTVEKFREQVQTELLQMKNYMKEHEIRASIMKKVLDGTDFTPPEKLIERDFDSNLLATEQDLERSGKTIEDFLKESNLTFEEWKKQERAASERRVKLGVIIGEIFDRENLSISKDDIGLELSRFAASNRVTTTDLKKLVKETDLHEHIVMNLRERKVLDLLVMRAKLKGKKVDAGDTPALEEKVEAVADAPLEDNK